MHIEIIPAAREQEPILANLLELYGYDFSGFHSLEVGSDGRFGYKCATVLERTRPTSVSSQGGWQIGRAGLVKRGSEVSGNEAVWDMAEFFIMRGYRRRGIGTQVAHQVWRGFPGLWEVRVMQSNVSAHHFWEQAISTFTGEAIHPVRVERGGEGWKCFSFQSCVA